MFVYIFTGCQYLALETVSGKKVPMWQYISGMERKPEAKLMVVYLL